MILRSVGGLTTTGLARRAGRLQVRVDHPKAVQAHLGHSSISVTMDTYGHLFPSDQEALAARLDGVYRGSLTDPRRTPDGHQVVELPQR